MYIIKIGLVHGETPGIISYIINRAIQTQGPQDKARFFFYENSQYENENSNIILVEIQGGHFLQQEMAIIAKKIKKEVSANVIFTEAEVF